MSDQQGKADDLTAGERPPRPKRPELDEARIPGLLRGLAQWVCWRYQRNGAKWTKVPINAATGWEASSTDAATWTTFERATQALSADDSHDGVGFVFTEEDGFAGVDLDDCIDSEGRIAPSAQEIIDAFNSYTEVSPSGHGVKVFLSGAKPPSARCKSKVITGYRETEVYDRSRFFTVTGQHLPGTRTDVMERQVELDSLCARLWPKLKRKAKSAPIVGGGFVGDDAALIEKAGQAKHGESFRALMTGDTTRHGGDDSAADLALCNTLAFWTGRDAERMDRIFRGSGLMRDKWDEMRGSATYGQRTIEKAITSCTSVYSGDGMQKHETGIVEVQDPEIHERDHMSLDERCRLRTDVGNAARLVNRYGDEIRFCYQTGCWYCWDGVRWRLDDTGKIDAFCVRTALAIIDEVRSADEDSGDALRKWGTRSQYRDRLKAMKELARPDLAIRVETFDSGKDLLNCWNGTVDLRTGMLREHRREDLITKLAPVDYDPDAICPLFIKFLREITDENESLIGYLQRYFGHALTGNANEQVLLIFHGEGGNGKNVLLDTISSVMGNYACEAPPNLLVVRKQSEHPTEIADLQGARLVVASENEKGAELKLALIKVLTGNQRLKARRMRQDFFEFHRTHKLVLLTNDLPILREKGEAARRRIRVVPFPVVIPESKRDPSLLERLIEERSGILAWLVRGAVEWAQNGLGTCEAVTQATEGYIGSVSGLDIFFEEMCEFDQDSETPACEIIAAHSRWSERKGRKPVSDKALANGLHRRQCVKGKHREQRMWRGVSLKEECARTDRTRESA